MFSQLLFNMVLLATTMRQLKKKAFRLSNGKAKLSLFTDNNIVYLENIAQ